MNAPIALATSPIQGPVMAPGTIPTMPAGLTMGPAPVAPSGTNLTALPPPDSGLPPGGAEDAMGTPSGAVAGEAMKAPVNFMVTMVRGHFETARMAKQDIERVWETAHDNYRGTAPRPAAEGAMRTRSKVTMKITRTKVAAAVARLKEIGFKWNVKPTPEPSLIDYSPAQLRSKLAEVLASMENKDLASQIKEEMNVDALMQQVKELARARADAMKLRIEDDLVEMGWDQHYDQGLLDGSLYGTMVFKGLLTKERRPGRWVRRGGSWGFLDVDPDVKLYRPEAENISPWDFYPSPGAWMVEKLDYGIVRNVMGHREVADLADNPGFDAAEVMACLADKTGAWTPEPWEHRLFASNAQSSAISTGLTDKFVVLDWWGYIKVADLKQHGGKIAKVPKWNNRTLRWEDSEPDDQDVVIANIWVCGNHVLRAWHTPLKPRRLPFFVVPYEKIPKSLWGQGVAWMMEDWQAVMNTVYRAMMDNMAISSQPIGWFDRSRLRADDKGVLEPGKMFEVKDTERLTIPPVQFHFPPNNVAHMRMIAEIARANIQESTSLPDLVQGMQTGATHNRTAAGMSMLGGWADTATRSVQKNIDQCLTKPLIRSLYFWEMQFSKDDQIKGDFEVEALGVESVMADEILTQRLIQYGAMAQQNAEAAKRMNWGKFHNALLKKMGLKEEGIGLSETEVQENEAKAMQAQAQAEAIKNRPEYQPQLSEKDFLLKAMGNLPEDSPIVPPILRKVLDMTGLLTPEINSAINIANHTNASLNAGLLSEADRAVLEQANAIHTNAGGPAPQGNGGAGIPAGVAAAGGSLPALPA